MLLLKSSSTRMDPICSRFGHFIKQSSNNHNFHLTFFFFLLLLQIFANGEKHRLHNVTGQLLENGHLVSEVDGHRSFGTVVQDGNELHVFNGV